MGAFLRTNSFAANTAEQVGADSILMELAIVLTLVREGSLRHAEVRSVVAGAAGCRGGGHRDSWRRLWPPDLWRPDRRPGAMTRVPSTKSAPEPGFQVKPAPQGDNIP